MMDRNAKKNKYWDTRGKHFFKYKGEYYYTITPIPHYYRRRKILLKLLCDLMAESTSILDYGCGDGYYLNYFYQRTPYKKFIGVDISDEMIAFARNRYQNLVVRHTSAISLEQEEFDFAYILMVLAHTDDKTALGIISDISRSLTTKGKLVLCEQTAPNEKHGEHWVRRSVKQYIKMAEDCGLLLRTNVFISFPAEQWFERHIAPTYRKLFVSGETDTKKRYNANRQFAFRFLSTIFTSLTICPAHQLKFEEIRGGGYGYSFLVFEKKLHKE